jgi:hypothetical protein
MFQEEPECSEPPRKRKKKRFYRLEHRFVGRTSEFTKQFEKWHLSWKKYATERDRQNALDGLAEKGGTSNWQWEYRIPKE